MLQDKSMNKSNKNLNDMSLRELRNLEYENWSCETQKEKQQVWKHNTSGRVRIERKDEGWILSGQNSRFDNESDGIIETFEEAEKRLRIWMLNHENGFSSMI